MSDDAEIAAQMGLGQRVLDLLFKWRREEVESGGRTYATEVIREVREQVARDIEEERDRLRAEPFPADPQWLRALDSAAAIARGGSNV